jgi:hypothetical protein
MLSDKFQNLVDPGRIRKVIHTAPDGHQTTIPKEWAEYTRQEKAQRIAYHQGCGEGFALFVLELEAELEVRSCALAKESELSVQVMEKFNELVKSYEARIAALEGTVAALDKLVGPVAKP